MRKAPQYLQPLSQIEGFKFLQYLYMRSTFLFLLLREYIFGLCNESIVSKSKAIPIPGREGL
jgi:hypothetical protein